MALGTPLYVSMYVHSHMCMHVFCVDINAHMDVHYKRVRQLLWALNWALSLAGGVTLGAMGAPHNALAAVWLLLGLAPLALREPDRRIPFTP